MNLTEAESYGKGVMAVEYSGEITGIISEVGLLPTPSTKVQVGYGLSDK